MLRRSLPGSSALTLTPPGAMRISTTRLPTTLLSAARLLATGLSATLLSATLLATTPLSGTLLTGVLLIATPALAAGADETIASALRARRAGHFDRARRLLLDLLVDSPSNARALHELGTLYAIHGQLGPAAEVYERALVADPGLQATRRALAEVLRADDRCDAALPRFHELEADPDSRALALRGIAICQDALGHPEEAIAALTTLAREHAGDRWGRWARRRRKAVTAAGARGEISPSAAMLEGDAHFRRRHFEAAAAWYGQACRTGPAARRCYRWAIALLASRDFAGAVAALRTALRLDPGHVPSLSAWPTAVRMLRTRGRTGLDVNLVGGDREPPERRAARALLEGDLLLARRISAAALQSGGGIVARLQHAEALLRDGLSTAADTDYRAALKARPGLLAARHGRAIVLLHRRRYAAARALIGLPAPAPLPADAHADPRATRTSPTRDLEAFERWRRRAFDHRMRMLLDPGVKPIPPFSWRDPVPPATARRAEPGPKPSGK